jgi:hypothetical protein
MLTTRLHLLALPSSLHLPCPCTGSPPARLSTGANDNAIDLVRRVKKVLSMEAKEGHGQDAKDARAELDQMDQL